MQIGAAATARRGGLADYFQGFNGGSDSVDEIIDRFLIIHEFWGRNNQIELNQFATKQEFPI